MYSMTCKGQGQNLTSGQGHVGDPRSRSHCILIEVSWWEKHNETTLTSLSFLNQKLLVKKRLVNLGDLRWPLEGHRWKLLPGSSLRTQVNTIPSEWTCSDAEKRQLKICPLTTWAVHEIDLTSGHEYKKSKIYKLLELLTLSTSKSLKTLGSELWLWKGVKLLNCVWRWRHLTRPGDLTWCDLGSRFLHKMCKGWTNSYAKFGDAARHHFPAICEKPMGGGDICAPGCARIKPSFFDFLWGLNPLTRALMGSGELHVLMGGGVPKGPPPYLQN